MRLIDADALKPELAPQDDWTWANGAYVRDMINAMPTVCGWISVRDRMPDNGQDVLVYIDDYDESRITGCNYDNGVWYDCVMNCEIVIPNITHLMPLPEPPKEDDDAEQ